MLYIEIYNENLDFQNRDKIKKKTTKDKIYPLLFFIHQKFALWWFSVIKGIHTRVEL